MNERYRLVTRSDFDGLVCAVLLRHLELIDEITFPELDDDLSYARRPDGRGRFEVTARPTPGVSNSPVDQGSPR